MTINERFEKVINELYLGNKSAFAKTIGVAPTVIENIVGTRKGNPSFNVIRKVLFANAKINPDWLILEIGAMVREVNSDEELSVNTILRRYETLAIENAALKTKNETLENRIEELEGKK